MFRLRVVQQHVKQLREMTNFCPCNKFVRVVNGTHLPIKSHRNLVIEFQSGQNSVRLKLIDVA